MAEEKQAAGSPAQSGGGRQGMPDLSGTGDEASRTRLPLTHLDETGAARMVDVAGKEVTQRRARARARLDMQAATRDRIACGQLPKGDALATARIAGIMAAKRTHELIPLCHPLPLSAVRLDIEPCDDPPGITIECEVAVTARTGAEMEALTACALAALAIYDMVKSVERGVRISQIMLIEKSGGSSGTWKLPEAQHRTGTPPHD